jgi:NAD(P)H dehydrogenase (quinone)
VPTYTRRRMQALVVIAHPCDDSFTHAAAGRAVAGLRSAGHEVEVVDLYALGFRVAMSPEERRAYHGETPLIDEHTREHARLVEWADCLVFVYPTWWSGLPAILKGWLERVMVPGVAFVFDDRSGKVRPGLRHVRRLVGISSYGSPRPVVKLINDNGRRTIARTLRLSCGLRTRTTWLGLYGIDTSSDVRRRQFLDRVEASMARLE